MKKSLLTTFSVLIICAFSAVLFSSCDKETDSTVDVVVIDQETNLPFAGVNVKICKDNSEISVEGVTDANGRVKATFKAPAIFDVVCTYETGLSDPTTGEKFYREGKNSVRLKDGETVECKVIVLKEMLRHY